MEMLMNGRVYQLSDGTIIFLETKFRMSKVTTGPIGWVGLESNSGQAHIDKQMDRMSTSLRAMGKRCVLTLLGLRPSQTRLYLAGYYLLA